MFRAWCGDCKASWVFRLALPEFLCPFCLRDAEVTRFQGETSHPFTDISILELQVKAMKRREAALSPKGDALTAADVEQALGLPPNSVEGTLDQNVGRFYVRSIRGPGGQIFFSVSQGNVCIFNLEKT